MIFQAAGNPVILYRDTVSPKGKYTLLSGRVLKTEGCQMKSRGCAILHDLLQPRISSVSTLAVASGKTGDTTGWLSCILSFGGDCRYVVLLDFTLKGFRHSQKQQKHFSGI